MADAGQVDKNIYFNLSPPQITPWFVAMVPKEREVLRRVGGRVGGFPGVRAQGY